MIVETTKRKKAAARDGVASAATEKDVTKRYHHAAVSSSENLRLECGELLLSVAGFHGDYAQELCLRLLKSTLGRYVQLSSKAAAA